MAIGSRIIGAFTTAAALVVAWPPAHRFGGELVDEMTNGTGSLSHAIKMTMKDYGELAGKVSSGVVKGGQLGLQAGRNEFNK